ncbi:hypothetical protein [Nocardioides sp. AX2bis]|uniref:hypothetical protein n=1 Tax=Nocardioides sp. AX2bis TaxID=2653157 RepID=UPI0012EF2DD0|nr:hypothetical protein [Nocardioides sp. AX2bis]VXB81202.1 conserved hypothetical protein [Nocardioides sp. AX2bis]
MAEQQQTALQRWGSTKKPWWFWPLVLVVAVPLIIAAVVWFAQLGDSVQDRRVELNARYEEQIDITGYPDGSGGRNYRIVIDGTTRDDCSEDDGVLTCTDDPQPTEQ